MLLIITWQGNTYGLPSVNRITENSCSRFTDKQCPFCCVAQLAEHRFWPANWPCPVLGLQKTGDHYVGKPSATCQPTEPTQPFLPSGVDKWVASLSLGCVARWRHLVKAHLIRCWQNFGAVCFWAKPGCCCCPAWQSVCRVIAALRGRLLYVVDSV